MVLNYNAIGKMIRDEREKRSWTQAKLAEEIGVTEQYISHIENGRKKVSLKALVNIAESFDLSLDYLVCMRSDPKRAESSRAERILVGCSSYEYEVLINLMIASKGILKQLAPLFKEKDKEKE